MAERWRSALPPGSGSSARSASWLTVASDCRLARDAIQIKRLAPRAQAVPLVTTPFATLEMMASSTGVIIRNPAVQVGEGVGDGVREVVAYGDGEGDAVVGGPTDGVSCDVVGAAMTEFCIGDSKYTGYDTANQR